MTDAQLEAMVGGITRAVREDVSFDLTGCLTRLLSLETRAPMPGPIGDRGPQGERGEKGLDGRDGLMGPAGPQGERGEKGLDGRDGLMGPAGPPGERGEKGLDGRDGLMGPAGPPGERGEKGLDGRDGLMGPAGPPGEPGPPGPAGPPGRDGLKGQDVDATLVSALRAEIASLHAELKTLTVLTAVDVRRLAQEEVTRALALLPAPRDGRDGLPGVPGPPGERGEKGLDGRDGLDGKDGTHGRDGQDGLGFEDLALMFDEERGYSWAFTRGDLVKMFDVALPYDAGVWKPGRLYPKGAGVTKDGAWWIAQEDTRAKPGEPTPDSRAWRLAVKAGRDAKGNGGRGDA